MRSSSFDPTNQWDRIVSTPEHSSDERLVGDSSASFDFFRRTYFTSRKVNLKYDSPTDLVNIAEHYKLGKQTQASKISLKFHFDDELIEFERLEKRHRDNQKAEEADSDPKEWARMKQSFEKLEEVVRASQDNEQNMRALGLAPARLGCALSHFSGLRITSLASFGWMEDEYDWLKYRSDGLNTVITALVTSKVSLSSLRLEDGAFLLGESARRPQSEALLLQENFQQLDSLHLSFRTALPDGDDYYDPVEHPRVDDALHFLSAAPHDLKELEICVEIMPAGFDGDADDHMAETAAPLCNDLFSRIHFPRLERLKTKSTFHTVG
ncbi:hypothetical protein IWZ03DRAFT_410742 [Phyllosticta citriasiana]|uniref:Uncharacterized protein n=1 Tax=Phyllosticta citriasiana TaxID=595635 RepID=A0ABR1KZZ5_9PEZI